MYVFLSIFATFFIIFIIPIIIYGIFAHYGLIQEPEKKTRFFVSVVIQKLGTSMGFVLLYALQNDINWLLYGLIWVVMFTIVEIGQSLNEGYSKNEAVAGVLSEIIYFPFAGYTIYLLLSL